MSLHSRRELSLLPKSPCPPPRARVAPGWVLPASISGRIIYLGKEHSGASRQPKIQKGLW